MSRPNLTVETYMQVHRVLFEGERAVGVQGARLGRAARARAEREVILCGGAYNSPHLLMLSGVGPAELLTHAADPRRRRICAASGRTSRTTPPRVVTWAHDEPVSLLDRLTRRTSRRSSARAAAR